jgi:hypothetical protein
MKKLVVYGNKYCTKWEFFGISQLDNIHFERMFVFADLRDIRF